MRGLLGPGRLSIGRTSEPGNRSERMSRLRSSCKEDKGDEGKVREDSTGQCGANDRSKHGGSKQSCAELR